MIFQDTLQDTPQDTPQDIYKRLERLEKNIKIPMYVSKKYITIRETPKALKAPKIWKICLEELYCDYFYTTISYQTLLNKMWIPKNKYKIVTVYNYFKGDTKMFVFQKHAYKHFQILSKMRLCNSNICVSNAIIS